jgi:hypothetical protein
VKRFGLIVLLILCGLFTLTLVSAQDEGTPSSLDQLPAGATPAPLPTRMPQPAPSSRARGEHATVDIYFPTLAQGDTGLLHVSGDNIQSVRARFINELIDFFPMDDGFYGLVSADMEQPPRRYPLDVFVTYDDGSREPINTEIELISGGFIAQEVTISADKAILISPDVERNELARLESLVGQTTLERYWDSTGFQLPVLSALTSPFGAFRTFNATLNTRHTGWDIRTTLGTPVMASAAGKVAFAGLLDIRGNYVLIDHGYGVYSGYAHFSQIHVTRGQDISKGQILGLSGDTGRTSGPHFHWEMAVNGEWVDSVHFLEMWMP